MLIAEFKEHGQEMLIYCVWIKQLSEAAESLSENKLHSPFILAFGHAFLILNVSEELHSGVRPALS